MKTTILLFTFLAFILQLKSQNSEVEIYVMQNNTIVKGKLLQGSQDSVRIMVDSVTTLAFAKSELEGKELSVSKEVNKFQKKLMRKESIEVRNSFPGIYQIKNGQTIKGKIMFGIATLGLVGLISSGVVFVAVLTTTPGLNGVLVAFSKSAILFATSTVFVGVGSGWSIGDKFKTIKQKVKNRYYYRGILPTGAGL
ncbi:MAG: hypothetical protein ACOYOT_02310 [Bacteroidales bacterium]